MHTIKPPPLGSAGTLHRKLIFSSDCGELSEDLPPCAPTPARLVGFPRLWAVPPTSHPNVALLLASGNELLLAEGPPSSGLTDRPLTFLPSPLGCDGLESHGLQFDVRHVATPACLAPRPVRWQGPLPGKGGCLPLLLFFLCRPLVPSSWCGSGVSCPCGYSVHWALSRALAGGVFTLPFPPRGVVIWFSF